MLYKRRAFEEIMKQKVITARVTGDIYDAIAAKASAEGVSLSAVAARLLSDSLKSGVEPSDQPDWAVELKKLESRLSQVEAQLSNDRQNSGNRKGKRR